MSSVESSDKKVSKVLLESHDDPPMKADLIESKPQLNDQARALMQKSWKDLTSVYGEYFVYGYIARANFRAIVEISTSSAKTRDEIKTKLTFTLKDKSGLDFMFKSIKETFKEDVDIVTRIEETGLGDNASDETSFSSSEISQVYAEYESWRKNLKPQPWKALLCHYSVISNDAPKPQDQFVYLGPHVKALYEDLFTVQIGLAKCTMRGAQDTAKKAMTLVKELSNGGASDATRVAKARAFTDECKEEVEMWLLREEFIDKLPEYQPKPGELDDTKWIEGGNTQYWTYGLFSVYDVARFRPLQAEIREIRHDYREPYSDNYNYGTSRVGEDTKLLIGFECHNKWADGTIGWFRWKRGKLGDSSVEVEWCSYRDRGFDWALTARFVDRELYSKNPGV